jgi:hypothetical protein
MHGGCPQRGGVEAMHDAWTIALESGQDLAANPNPRICGINVGWVVQECNPTLIQKSHHLASPDPQQRAHKNTATGGHTAKPGQSAAAHQVQHDTLDDVVGRMSQGDHVCAGLAPRALEEIVSKGTGSSLNRPSRHRRAATFDDDFNAKLYAQGRDVIGGQLRSNAQGVVVVGGDDIVT